MIATKQRQKKIRNFSSLLNTIVAPDNAEIIRPVAPNNQPAKDSFFENRAMLQSFQPEQSISRKLDAMIEAGAAFDVTEDSFEVIGGERLPETDRQYLTTNKMPVLCTLHQRLLMKHWFNDSPELLESFAFDIFERESILAEENELYTYETYYEAVSETSQKWFINLLDAIPD